MNAAMIEAVGMVAAVLTTISFVPQVWHSFKTRDVSGISLTMYSIFTVGIALWLVYGIYLNLLPVIIANSVILLLSLVLLYFKFAFKDSSKV